MKKTIAALTAFVIMLTVFSVSASAKGYEFDLKRDDKQVELHTDTLLVVSLDTGDVVFEKNADEKRYPASTTKIMTYIITAENVEDFDNTRVLIKEDVLEPLEGTDSSLSGIYEHIGEEMTVTDLLHCLMVSSGNDAAMILADYIGAGSISHFVDMMNQKAKELGCENTHFANPHGLHDENHYTTAYDLYKMTKYALTLPKFAEITNTTTYYCEGDDYPLTTTNSMIDENRGGEYYYRYAKGIKTGTTNAAGMCLVSTGYYEGYAYMIIALHAPGPEESDVNYAMIDSANLYRWAFLNLEMRSIINKSTPVCEQKLNFAWQKEGVLLTPEKNFTMIIPQDAQDGDIRIEPHCAETADAPVKEGDILGTADVYYKGDLITTINLVSSEDVERSQLLYIIYTAKQIVSSPIFLILLAVAAVLLIIYLIIATVYGRRKKTRRRVRNYRDF